MIVTCFRKKYAGILSEKEILGSKHVNRCLKLLRFVVAFQFLYFLFLHMTLRKLTRAVIRCRQKVGLAQAYAASHLPASAYQIRHGVFMEYCRHGMCAHCKEVDYSLLKIVVPISCFRSDFENRWIKMLLDSESDFNFTNSMRERDYVSCSRRSYVNLIRKIFRAKILVTVQVLQKVD
ncbi:hypothetical protein ACH5RR_027260 [Cinchona calisaya]|uniref:CST complex subunit CTC1 n=1 Tax=Cinchona calisaya TaxID=153742 RepID=A0ABD2Z4Z0_9GENT